MSRRRFNRTCPTGKVRLRDETAAALALAEVKRKRNGLRVEQRYYECPRCKGWHLTSQPARRSEL